MSSRLCEDWKRDRDNKKRIRSNGVAMVCQINPASSSLKRERAWKKMADETVKWDG